jgi:hypothetical protein
MTFKTGNIFVVKIWKEQETAKIYKPDNIKLRSFFTARQPKAKRQLTELEKIFTNNSSEKWLIVKKTRTGQASLAHSCNTGYLGDWNIGSYSSE